MAKKDFLSELANEVEDKKSGKRDHIVSVDEFHSSHTHFDNEDTIQNAIDALNAQEEINEVQEGVKETIAEEVKPAKKKKQEDMQKISEETMYEGNHGKPGSFEEEEFVQITKPKKKLSKAGIGILAAIAVAVVAGIIYMMMPKITMPNFVGRNISEVSNWARQNSMESNAIATNEPVYSLEYDQGVVMEQSVAEGTKIKTSTPITFTVSNGPDPNENIDFPSDIMSMTQQELNEWISENKLTKTKITTEYSTTVESGNVIAYELKNVDASDFTRNSTLNIRVSKGAQPAGQITVTDFVGKNVAEVTSWASKNQINLEQVQTFSDTVTEGLVISQSIAAQTNISQGDTLTVTVSKGKGVKIPNLVGYSKEELTAWTSSKDNNVIVVSKEVYNEAAPGSVISQSIAAGSVVESGEVLELTVSLYLPVLQTNSREWLGRDWMELKAWCDEANWKGADIQAGQYGAYQYNECSDEFPTPGQIIDYACMYGNTEEANGCGRPLNVGSRIAYKISTGPCTVTPSETAVVATPTPTAEPTVTSEATDTASTDTTN